VTSDSSSPQRKPCRIVTKKILGVSLEKGTKEKGGPGKTGKENARNRGQGQWEEENEAKTPIVPSGQGTLNISSDQREKGF